MEASHAAPAPAKTVVGPAGDPNRAVVAQLQRSDLFQDYHAAFETTTGLPLALRATGSFQFPLQGSKRSNPFCTLMAGANRTCAACLQLQQEVEESAATEPKSLRCFAGLTEAAVPVRVGAQVLGHLQTGQVLLQPPTEAGFRAVSQRLPPETTPEQAERIRAAYFRTRVVARAEFDSVLRLLAIFAQHLGAVSNRMMVRETATESPLVTRARAFIHDRYTQELSVCDVARAVNMSTFYFCKVFKQGTGLTFTHYLARLRVEAVKQQLLNPHVRISEAAFAAGFQSLSQFNRVFRRIAGEAPSAHRARTPGPGGTGIRAA